MFEWSRSSLTVSTIHREKNSFKTLLVLHPESICPLETSVQLANCQYEAPSAPQVRMWRVRVTHRALLVRL